MVTDCSISTLVTLVGLTLFTKDSCLHNMIHKWKGRKSNFIIIRSFICYTIVFVLYVLQDKIWHIVMNSPVMRACIGGGVINRYFPSPIQEKSSFRGQLSFTFCFLYCPCTADRTGAGECKIVKNVLEILHIKNYHPSCHSKSDTTMVLNNEIQYSVHQRMSSADPLWKISPCLMIVQSQLSNCNAAQQVSEALGVFTKWKVIFPEFGGSLLVPFHVRNELNCVSHR